MQVEPWGSLSLGSIVRLCVLTVSNLEHAT